MEFISVSIARCHGAESADADASSYDVGSPALVKQISGGCDIRSDLRGMTRQVAVGVAVGWSKAESFGCAESVDSVREFLVTRETDLVLWVGPS